MSKQYPRATSEHNADFDMQSQPPSVQDTIKAPVQGERGHWFNTYLSNSRDSQRVQMADLVSFFNNACDGRVLDEDLKCVLVHERPVMITSPKFFLKHAWPSLAMNAIVRQLLELSSSTPHEGLESDQLLEIIATYCATTFQGRSGSTVFTTDDTAPTKAVRWNGIEEVTTKQTLAGVQKALQIDMLTPLTKRCL